MRSHNLIAAGLVVLTTANLCRADDHDHDQTHTHTHKHPKSTVATPHTFRQAGYPQCVSRISMVSYNEHYSGGYVGGGKTFGGSEPCPHQGTWGWDYSPFRSMSQRLFMKYSNGRHYEGGFGSYATDGPKPIEHITESVHEHFGKD